MQVCAAVVADLERPRAAAAADLQQVAGLHSATFAAHHSVALPVVDTPALAYAALVGTSQVARSWVPAGKRLAYKLAAGRRFAGRRFAEKQRFAASCIPTGTRFAGRLAASTRLADRLAASTRLAGTRLAGKQVPADTRADADTPSFFARQSQ